jgi:hypothetical protein
MRRKGMEREVRIIHALLLASVVLGLVLSGCDIGGVEPLDKSRVQIAAFVYPVSENQQAGLIEYRASCQIQDTSADDGHGDFSSAVVKVNDVGLFSPNGWLFLSPNVGTLSTGDAVVLLISESRLGQIQIEAVVPVSVTSFMLNPSLPPKGTPNTQDTYQMSWTANGADLYRAGYFLYDDSYNILKGILRRGSSESCTFGPSDLVYLGTVAPFVNFLLHTTSAVPITGFKNGSVLDVSGVTIVSQSNI